MSRRQQEKRIKEEQEATARVFKDFLDTFHNSSPAKINKTFIKSSVLYNDKSVAQMGELYNPKPLVGLPSTSSDVVKAIECAKILKEDSLTVTKKHQKLKSNLELLKEELKQKHIERKDRIKELSDPIEISLSNDDGQDLATTNLYLTNINPKITEQDLMLDFGLFGPLASVKIMWPRGDNRIRSTNCGFVAFMSQKDAERAYLANKNRVDMNVGWGKAIEIPPHPIYVPDGLLKLYLPPPETGLPFNAQPPKTECNDKGTVDDFLQRCCVKVTIPLNRKQLMTIHRMVEFVIKEGPQFEAIIMNREINNVHYDFLFDNQSPLHIYYRWKLFSILHCDPQKSWKKEPFRMFKGGSIWIPPVNPDFTLGMPDLLLHPQKSDDSNHLSERQMENFMKIIRSLTTDRKSIGEAFVFCIDHKSAINDCITMIIESMQNIKTHPVKKIARLYLLSDVLSNCKKHGIELDLLVFEPDIIKAFDALYVCYRSLKYELDQNSFKYRVLNVIRHWDISQILSVKVMEQIERTFLEQKVYDDEDQSSLDEPLDGAKLLERTLNSEVGPEVVTKADDSKNEVVTSYFVSSKWDEVDPEELENQSVSAREIYIMEKLKKKQKHKKRNHKH